MSDDSANNEVTNADHIHSFGSGAVLGGTIGLVIDYTDKMEMSTMEGLGVAITAGLAVGFIEGVAEAAAGIKYKKQRLTGAFGIGAGFVVIIMKCVVCSIQKQIWSFQWIRI